MANKYEPKYEIDRRGFLTTLMLIPVGAKLAGCGDDNGGSGSPLDAGSCDGLDVESSPVANHTHVLCVLQDDLDDPPEGGKTYETDLGLDVPHTHTVTLTQAQLQAIADNGTVEVQSSSDNGHAHPFTIGLAGAS